MTTKTIKTILFTSLIAAMILPFSGMDFVNAEKNNTRNDMKSLSDEIKTADLSSKDALVAQYKVKNDKMNESIYQKPARDFVSEWKSIDLVGMELAEEQHKARSEGISQAEIDKIDNKIHENRKQIDKLQSEALEFMKLDDVLENKFTNIIQQVEEKYANVNSPNAFMTAGIDYEQKKLVFELTTENDNVVEFENSSIGIAEDIRTIAGESDVFVHFDRVTETSCSNYLSTCTPRVGGVVIARYDDPTNLSGSIGYKAVRNGVTGYVTAGHVVDYYGTGNRKMIQPQSGSIISDGTNQPWTDGKLAGDVSFQVTSVGIDDDLYYSSSTKIDVASYATLSADHPGQFIYRMGAGNGLLSGQVTTHYTTYDMWRTSTYAVQGDSGGPVYQITGYSGGQYYGKVFGHMSHSIGGSTYQPTEKIITNYNIIPAT